MINPFNPLELLPYIRDEEYAGALIERYVGASPLERNRILEQAKELGRPPVIVDFHFPEIQTGETDDLLLFEGYSTARKKALAPRGEIKTQNIQIPQILVVDKQKRFEFTIEHNAEERMAFITVCQIYEQHRRKGYFSLMVGAITRHCFNELKLRSVSGTASPPRTEPEKDWRCDRVAYRKNFETGEMVELTKLHKLWLSQKYAVHGKVLGSDEAESFALLNPKYLSDLPKEELISLDEHHPKIAENTFIHLIEQKGAVA